MIFQKRAKKNSNLEFHIGKETIDTVQEYTYLGAGYLTFDRGGGVGDFEKRFPASACRKKKCMQHKCNRKLMGKKGKKYPDHQIARKKILDDQKSPTPSLKS